MLVEAGRGLIEVGELIEEQALVAIAFAKMEDAIAKLERLNLNPQLSRLAALALVKEEIPLMVLQNPVVVSNIPIELKLHEKYGKAIWRGDSDRCRTVIDSPSARSYVGKRPPVDGSGRWVLEYR